MNYLYDKIMYLIIVLSLFLISYLIFKKPKRMSLLSINELEDPPKYEDIFIINKPKIILLIEDSLLYVKKTSFYYQKFVNSQKAEIKRTFFLIVIALLIYFLFFSTLPGHEKILINVFAAGDETCTGIGYTQDPDINSTQCTAYGCYEVGNEATCCPPTANSNNPVYDGSLTFISGTFDDCCGDDSNEYYEECDENVDIFWGGSCGTTDRACCTGANSCIDPDSALCYNNATSYNITGITSGNDQYARCTPSGLWDDCDSDSSTCTNCANVGDWSQSECSGSNCFTYSGEAGVGEYPDTSTEQCCGDDSGENAIIEYNASDAPPPYNDDNTGTTCCNSASDCAETGNKGP